MPHPVGGAMGMIYVIMIFEGDTHGLKWFTSPN